MIEPERTALIQRCDQVDLTGEQCLIRWLVTTEETLVAARAGEARETDLAALLGLPETSNTYETPRASSTIGSYACSTCEQSVSVTSVAAPGQALHLEASLPLRCAAFFNVL